MKKILALVLTLTIALCGLAVAAGAEDNVKFGFIFVGDEAEGYTAAHYAGVKAMCDAMGWDVNDTNRVEVIWNVPENEETYDAAIRLVEDGCTCIVANSFGHEDYMLQAAAENEDVMFLHATGYQARSSGLANMRNFFVDVFESRYVSGVVAGIKLNELIDNGDVSTSAPIPIGYVGAKSYAEVISGYTAFYLGLRSIAKADTVMYVNYTGEWADQQLEYDAALSLINNQKVVLLSQHADTTGAASACQEAKVFHVGYNVGMIETAPDYHLTSSSLNWGAYYTYAAQSLVNGTEIEHDWSYGYGYEGGDAVLITEINAKAFASEETYNAAVAAANETVEGIKNGTVKVFNTASFTVKGETVTTTEGLDGFFGEYIVTENGVSWFNEQGDASAPAFSFIIDGIVTLN